MMTVFTSNEAPERVGLKLSKRNAPLTREAFLQKADSDLEKSQKRMAVSEVFLGPINAVRLVQDGKETSIERSVVAEVAAGSIRTKDGENHRFIAVVEGLRDGNPAMMGLTRGEVISCVVIGKNCVWTFEGDGGKSTIGAVAE